MKDVHISNLSQIPITEVVECLLICFQNYFVKMPVQLSFWENRFRNARVSWEHSWGIFSEKKLIGFVINAIDEKNDQLTAFNTGTGVMPAHRRQGWVKKMYDFGIPKLKEIGVTQCTLEVIDENAKAIRLYKRIGFTIDHEIKCYQGEIKWDKTAKIQTMKIDFEPLKEFQSQYSWDNCYPSISSASSPFKAYQMHLKGNQLSYFIINPENGYIAQLEAPKDQWEQLFKGIQQISTTIKINNIPTSRAHLLDYLDTIGIENTVNQYEMSMPI